MYNSKLFFVCVSHLIYIYFRKQKFSESSSIKDFYRVILKSKLYFFVPHAVSIMKINLNGGDGHQTSSGGSLTEEDLST